MSRERYDYKLGKMVPVDEAAEYGRQVSFRLKAEVEKQLDDLVADAALLDGTLPWGERSWRPVTRSTVVKKLIAKAHAARTKSAGKKKKAKKKGGSR